MTPMEIEFLIHCHTCSLRYPRFGALATQNAISSFLSKGLIVQESDQIYKTTELGAKYIGQICSLEPPEKPKLKHVDMTPILLYDLDCEFSGKTQEHWYVGKLTEIKQISSVERPYVSHSEFDAMYCRVRLNHVHALKFESKLGYDEMVDALSMAGFSFRHVYFNSFTLIAIVEFYGPKDGYCYEWEADDE